ncbi:hypothetical protein SAY87_020977 [Trapa incisa]|uniref:Uncharacterized protein n=1 Tax=Trapa incisa TaxID=236973 RepID=A0AAN7PQC6_9MYRT|nr:hypothetical protein SAY87_020977 [Trapa incisa]
MSADNYESDGPSMKKTINLDVGGPSRGEMAALYESLRSQLPLEYLKENGSVEDQMHEAAKYAKHLEKKIKGLGEKRDELLGKSACSCTSDDRINPPVKYLMASGQEGTVSINLSGYNEVEVAINTSEDQGLSLGRVLKALIAEGLIINSCTSAAVDGKLLHSIHCQITDAEGADITKVQQKMKNFKF